MEAGPTGRPVWGSAVSIASKRGDSGYGVSSVHTHMLARVSGCPHCMLSSSLDSPPSCDCAIALFGCRDSWLRRRTKWTTS